MISLVKHFMDFLDDRSTIVMVLYTQLEIQ